VKLASDFGNTETFGMESQAVLDSGYFFLILRHRKNPLFPSKMLQKPDFGLKTWISSIPEE